MRSDRSAVKGWRRSLRRGASVAALGIGALVVTSVPAFGAGTSYGGGGGGTSNFPGLPGSVVTTCTLTAAASSCVATIGGNTITINIPAGDLPPGAQLVITSITGDTPIDGTPVLEFALGVFNNGAKITTSFAQPLTVTVSGADITSSTKVFEQTSTGFTPVGAVTQTGALSFPVSADPAFQLDNSPTASVPIAGATLAVTGKPFLGEELLAGSLVLLGSGLLLGLRLRRRSSAA
jgi:hypothetical protein